MLLGQGLWVVWIAYACSFLGALQVPVFMAAMTYALMGFIYNVKQTDAGDGTDENGCENMSILEKCASFWDSPAVNSTPHRARSTDSPGPSSVENVTSTRNGEDVLNETILNKEKARFKLKPLESEYDGDSSKKSQSGIYFKALFMACLVTILYKQLLVLCLAFIPIAIYLCNRLLEMFGFKEAALEYIEELKSRIQVQLMLFSSSHLISNTESFLSP